MNTARNTSAVSTRGLVAAGGSEAISIHSMVPIMKQFGEVIMDENETVGGYAVPVDPMDLLQCDSCQ